MSEAPRPFGAYLLVERLRGARATWRAVPQGVPEAAGDGPRAGDDGHSVALKRIGRVFTREAGRRSGARRLPSLYHVNLAAPLVVGEADGERFVVSELAPGRSLESLLRGGPLPVVGAAWLVAEVARGLAFLHRAAQDGATLVHRRVGPRTVVITPSGTVRLCALDEAVAPPPRHAPMPPLTDDERGLRAPEQRSGEPVDPRTDLFALGALLHLAAGAPDTEDGRAGAPAGSLDAAAHDPARHLPESLALLAARCTAPSRHLRPSGAAEVEVALRAWLAEVPESFGPEQMAALLSARASVPEEPAGDETVDDGEPDDTAITAPRRRPGWLTDLRPARHAGDPPDTTSGSSDGDAETPEDHAAGARALDGCGEVSTPSELPPTEPRGVPKAATPAGAMRIGRRGRATGRPMATLGLWSIGAGALVLLLTIAMVGGATRPATSSDSTTAETQATHVPATRGGAATLHPDEPDSSLQAIARALCTSFPGAPVRFSADDERVFAASGSGGERERAAAIVAALLTGNAPADRAAAAHVTARRRDGVAGLTALALVLAPDAGLREARLEELAGAGGDATPDLRRPPAVAAVCERDAAARALVEASTGSPTGSSPAAPWSSLVAMLDRYLRATQRGQGVDLGGLRVALTDARRDAADLVVTLRFTNYAPTPRVLPLGSLRVEGDAAPPTLRPDVDVLAANSVIEVEARFPGVPREVLRAGAVITLAAATGHLVALAATSELLP